MHGTFDTAFYKILKEGNVLFNDALNTFYLWLYGVSHMVKDHSEKSKRGNPLLPHGLLFFINSKGSFICTMTDRITHTTAFVTPVVEHWLEWEIAQYKILNAIGDTCERTCCPKVLFYVANNFLWLDLSQCLCSRYHDIQKIGGKW